MMYCNALGFMPAFAILVQNSMAHGMGRHYLRQRLLMALVELLGKALKYGVIVDGDFRQVVPV